MKNNLLCLLFIAINIIINGQQRDTLTSWFVNNNHEMPYIGTNVVCGYDMNTNEAIIFGGRNLSTTINPSEIWKYSYDNDRWISTNDTGVSVFNTAQYYTTYNNVIYYYAIDNIYTYSMTDGSTDVIINTSSINAMIYEGSGGFEWRGPCLSVDSIGNFYLSSGGRG